MQPYSYVPYPNSVPAPYVTPMVYQTPHMPHVGPVYDPYAGVSYNPQIVGYTPVQPTSYIPVAPVPNAQNHPVAGYYSNGVSHTALTNFPGPSRSRVKPAEAERQKKLFENLANNGNVNALLQQKGTNVNISKIYHVKKAKPGFQKDWDDDDDVPQPVPMEPPRPPTLRQPAMIYVPPMMPPQRIPSATSTCSDCSQCNSPNGNRNCADCNAEWEYERSQRRRDNGN